MKKFIFDTAGHKESYHQVPLPAWKTFEAFSVNDSPFSLFHKWVAEQFGGIPNGKKISVSASKLTPGDMINLKQLVYSWLAKYHKVSKPRMDKEYGWHNLGIGPGEFIHPPEWAEPGYAYVCKDRLLL